MYCYGGNNPVRYVDPDGRYEVDYENKNILTDLESLYDMKRSEYFYKYNQNFSLCAMDKNGNEIVFSEYKYFKNFQKLINGRKINPEDVLSTLANCTYIISETGKTIEQFRNISETIGKFSTLLSTICLGIDIVQCIDDPNISNLYDIISTGIGFIPVYGSILSTDMSISKSFIEILGDMTYYGNQYLDYYYKERMFEEILY